MLSSRGQELLLGSEVTSMRLVRAVAPQAEGYAALSRNSVYLCDAARTSSTADNLFLDACFKSLCESSSRDA